MKPIPLSAPCQEDVEIFLEKDAIANACPRSVRIGHADVKVPKQLKLVHQ